MDDLLPKCQHCNRSIHNIPWKMLQSSIKPCMARTVQVFYKILTGDHLWSGRTTYGSHAWSGGPSVAATLSPGDRLWGTIDGMAVQYVLDILKTHYTCIIDSIYSVPEYILSMPAYSVRIILHKHLEWNLCSIYKTHNGIQSDHLYTTIIGTIVAP